MVVSPSWRVGGMASITRLIAHALHFDAVSCQRDIDEFFMLMRYDLHADTPGFNALARDGEFLGEQTDRPGIARLAWARAQRRQAA